MSALSVDSISLLTQAGYELRLLRVIRCPAIIAQSGFVLLVDELVGAGEGACAIQCGTDESGFQRFRRGLAWKAGQLHVAETVENEAWFPLLQALTLEGVRVGL